MKLYRIRRKFFCSLYYTQESLISSFTHKWLIKHKESQKLYERHRRKKTVKEIQRKQMIIALKV